MYEFDSVMMKDVVMHQLCITDRTEVYKWHEMLWKWQQFLKFFLQSQWWLRALECSSKVRLGMKTWRRNMSIRHRTRQNQDSPLPAIGSGHQRSWCWSPFQLFLVNRGHLNSKKQHTTIIISLHHYINLYKITKCENKLFTFLGKWI